MSLEVTVRINDEVVITAQARNTGETYAGHTVYDYHIRDDGDVSQSGKLLHKRERGATELTRRLMEKVESAQHHAEVRNETA